MQQDNDDNSLGSPETVPTFRRPLLRAIAGTGVLGVLGVSHAPRAVRAAIPGVAIDYKRCKVAFVTNASAIDAIAVYYADRDGTRRARYDIAPTVTTSRGYAPLIVEYDPDEDRTQIQLAEPRGALVCVVAEAASDRTVVTNPNDVCVPEGFNTAPVATFTIETDGTVAVDGVITVDELVTVTSTATDPDEPERLQYEWDLDGDGIYERHGETATVVYSEAGELTLSHRVTDDCGASATGMVTVTVVPAEEAPPGDAGIVQVAKLAPTGSVRAGTAVSLDGDTAIVCGLNNESRAGEAYVFTQDMSGAWNQVQSLVASDSSSGDGFGISVSQEGDTVVIGSRFGGPSESGAAYVFERDASGIWAETQRLLAEVPQEGAEFGVNVSLDGDTIAVGSSQEDIDGKTDAGAVYLFERDTDGVWALTQMLEGFTRAGDFFGNSVSLDGDRLAITAVFDDRGSRIDAGTAYVYRRDSSGTWHYEAGPRAADGEGGDRFGIASLDGRTLVVGAFRDDVGADVDAGSAYVFDRGDDDTWTQTQKLVGSNVTDSDNFGRAVALDEDVLIIGALFADSPAGEGTGAIYLFTPDSDGVWRERAVVGSDDGASGDAFGGAVSIDGDRVLVGARLDERAGNRFAGSAYLFEIRN